MYHVFYVKNYFRETKKQHVILGIDEKFHFKYF